MDDIKKVVHFSSFPNTRLKQEGRNKASSGEFIRHPFLGKHVTLTSTEQRAIDLEKRYQNLIDALSKYHIRKDPIRKEDIKRELKELKADLDSIWDLVRVESLQAFNEELETKARVNYKPVDRYKPNRV